jgi:hypothetical protein
MSEVLARDLLTTKQAAHALGISVHQLGYMYHHGEATPAYKIPGKRGGYMWTRAEVTRILDASDRQRRAFRRRRINVPYPLNGLQPVLPRPRKPRLGPPPVWHRSDRAWPGPRAPPGAASEVTAIAAWNLPQRQKEKKENRKR